ncbi:deoxyuridine 5'-triphosphate nucleotidohydrolase [Peribacillus frigoritolerans]|uniref:dUTP diphosphatase n=1 Tax=Peribacillus frigoritolerans TaxID=450367 RepID=UPI002E20D9D2|nr:deoxyuridine 5'-triphosphate nucleotidohydrolase [Peribacillus frigoritolerans]MED3845554.1 deoxyuridine 5'-triphosphate nucleotidohydrolase [Peribacillus frigoritolerans]
MRIRIKKVRDDIPTPGYAYKGDSGYDLIAGETTVVRPGETVKIPTGLAFEIAEGYEMTVRPRSGFTSNTKLRVQLGTVDSGYIGEVSVIVDNITEVKRKTLTGKLRDWVAKRRGQYDHAGEILPEGTYVVEKGTRIAQGVIAPVVQARFSPLPKGVELSKTDRGEGGFGSSGVKS